ncbi:MAG TPA: AraC family transcriptional regulator [Haliscomenobacter sp.]|uniref:helix-turn-helix domain-containing protein n=1 Tax=Haliscomenobacter sp. TaxID=2717303 RepID=UPI002C8C7DC5|nr:AraC family transcriptional regulator [Haliscomenobacter sp.]HOY18580.1 AraC family transcriptional regulator [Haliscomenobacter sp.]
MTLHFWAIAAIVAAAQGLLLAVLLFSIKENRLPNRILGLLMSLLVVTLLEWALWWMHLMDRVPGFKVISYPLQLGYGPLLFLYFTATFERQKMSVQKVLLHAVPFGLTTFFLLPFYLRFYSAITAYLHWIPEWPLDHWYLVPVFIQMITYGVWMKTMLRPHVQKNQELKRWSVWLVNAYWGIVLTFMYYRFSHVLGLHAPQWRQLDAVSLTFFIYLVAWLGYIEPRVFAGMPLQEAIKPIKYRNSALGAKNSLALFLRISELMEKERLFCDSELSLDLLAQKLKAQRHHVSQAINEQAGKSFADFVNEYRVKAAQELLLNTSKQELNAIEIAYQVGFGTKNAFNLAFKKMTGTTPSAYRQSSEKKV